MGIARTVYMYILIVGALALMSTDRFSFDVLKAKDPAWSSVVLFWLTIVMLSGAYYMFDRSIRKTRWFSILMSGMFMVAVVYPFYTLSDPRLMVVRIGTGIVVMFAVHSLYRTVFLSADAFRETGIVDLKGLKPRKDRRVSNLTRMREVDSTDNDGGFYRHGEYREVEKDREDYEDTLLNEYLEKVREEEARDRELQRVIDELLGVKDVSRMSDRMSRVRARRELPKRMTRIVRMSDLKLNEESTKDCLHDTGLDDIGLDADRKDNDEE